MGLLLLRGRFGPVAASDIELSVGAALRSANAALSGLILDLRDTSGGSIDQAIQIADAFLEAGIITTLETRGAAAITHRARSGDIAGGKPIVVLINAGTTSAAEILAAALQDNKRATLIGSKSAGLGSTSTFVPLAGNRGAIRMKTGRYLTPSGRPLDKSGIKPDIEIKPAKDDAASACREVDMPAENGDGQCERRPVRDDPVLQAAIAHLTGLAASAKP